MAGGTVVHGMYYVSSIYIVPPAQEKPWRAYGELWLWLWL